MWKAAPGALIVVVVLMLAGAGQASAQLPRPSNYACSRHRRLRASGTDARSRLRWEWDTSSEPSDRTRLRHPDCFSRDTASVRDCVLSRSHRRRRQQSTRFPVIVHIDRTPPAVSAAASRPPDYNGWFNHPDERRLHGQLTQPPASSRARARATAGPDAAGVVLSGTCQDVAGNVGSGSFALNYDSTAPAAPDVTATPERQQGHPPLGAPGRR